MNNRDKKNKRLNIRISEFDYYYFMDLKSKNINLTNHIISTLRTTDLYKNYYHLLNG